MGNTCEFAPLGVSDVVHPPQVLNWSLQGVVTVRNVNRVKRQQQKQRLQQEQQNKL